MKIYLNADGRGPGGPPRWAARFMAELRARGYEVTHDVHTHCDAAFFNIASAGMERLLDRKVPVAYRVAGCYIPEWFAVMGREMEEQHRSQNQSIRKAIEISSKVIYQSAWAKAQLDRVLLKRDHDCATIHNGVSPGVFTPSNVVNKTPVIASGGSLRYRFRLWTLFQLSRTLSAPHSLLIAGPLDEECRQALDEHIADPTIGARIRYTGDLSEEDWARTVRQCDILFHPVCGDWCPNVVVEALMSGVPVVAPRYGGASELLGGGGLAFECEPWRYFEPPYSDSAAEACRKVLDNLQIYKAKARLHAEKSLTIGQMTDSYLDVLGLPKRVPSRVSFAKKIKTILSASLVRQTSSGVNSRRVPAMRIGYSFVDLAFGGAQVFFVDLIERLARRGHEIRYHLFADQNDPILCDERLHLQLNRFAKRVNLDQIIDCDVIHLDGYHTPLHKGRLQVDLNKCVETFHSEYSIRTSGPNFAANRVVVSKSLRLELPVGCRLIYQGIDPDLFAPTNTEKDYDLAIIGRIHPAKNHLLFLEICRLVSKERPIGALIIGDYPCDDNYTKQVRLAIEGLQAQGIAIHVTGFVDNRKVPDYLNRSRILLVTSPSEGFGRMAAEALVCEVPVVANDTGGLREIIAHGSNGFLAKYNDADDFARLALRLLKNESLRRQLGSRGRADMVSRFSVAQMIEQYEQLYCKVAEAAGIPKTRE